MQYPIYCRKRGSVHAPEEVIPDAKKPAEGEAFMAIGGFPSPMTATCLPIDRHDGISPYTLQVKDLRTGELLNERVERVGSIEWANENDAVLYRGRRGTEPAVSTLSAHARSLHHRDVLVYEESDERFDIGAGKTRDGKYLLLESASHTTAEQYFFPPMTRPAYLR